MLSLPVVLERHGAKLYTARAKRKALSVIRTTQALRSDEASTVSVKAHQTLTSQEPQQEATVQSTSNALRQRAARAEHDIQQLRARVQAL